MTERLSMFPLRVVLLPGDILPLHIFEPRYHRMLERCSEGAPCFGVVLIRSGSDADDTPQTYEVGTEAIIRDSATLPDGRRNLVVVGGRRFRILESDWDQGYMTARVRWLEDMTESSRIDDHVVAVERIRASLRRYLEAYMRTAGREGILRQFDPDPVAFAYEVGSTLPMPLERRQKLLEAEPSDGLLRTLEETVRHETSLLAQTGAFAALPGHVGSRFTRN